MNSRNGPQSPSARDDGKFGLSRDRRERSLRSRLNAPSKTVSAQNLRFGYTPPVFRTRTGRILLAAPPFFAAPFCFAAPTFSTGVTTGNLANALITEASGIVASRMNPNVLWTHNDSGHNPEIFPI